MKVLWVSLVKFPPLCNKLKEAVPPSCGWLYASAKAVLNEMDDLQLGVAVYSYKTVYEEYDIDGVKYYMIPSKKMSKTDKRQIEYCRRAIKSFQPDLIHIHGTEHSLAQAICEANQGKIKTVANIQGLASAYTRYTDGGLNFSDKILNITPLDFFRRTFMLCAKKSMRSRGQCEVKVIRQLTDIIGRTQWDHDHALTLNPDIRYHFLNETLRDSFYEEPAWSLEKCKRHTIFVSNSSSPLKGAHQVLKALPIILRYYPDTVANFCGSSVLNNDFHSKLHFQGYHLYLRRLVKKLNLQNNVRFLGTLDEQQMKQAFLEANVYVMPSAIENSPNSLCEAQMLGVPAIASYCGGTPTLVKDGKSGFLYRYEEFEMLAQLTMRLFSETDFSSLSQNEMDEAFARHDRSRNAVALASIYNKIMGC